MRDAGTCLGGFLGMFLGAMLGFAICMKFAFEKVARNDGTVQPNQAVLPFLGVMAAACVGAVAGAVGPIGVRRLRGGVFLAGEKG